MRRFAGIGLNHGDTEAQRNIKKKPDHELHERARIRQNKELSGHRWTQINTDVPRIGRRELKRVLLTDCTEKKDVFNRDLNHGDTKAQRSIKKKPDHELHERARIRQNKELTGHRWTQINTDVPRIGRREVKGMLLTDWKKNTDKTTQVI